jgi:murein DD-endopeptidase MepM/ murein hydrolase activator NlpD
MMKLLFTLWLSLWLGLPTVLAQSAGQPKTVAVKAPGKKVAATKSKRPAQRGHAVVRRAPPPPAAQLAAGHDTALEAGCLDADSLPLLHERLQLQTGVSQDEQPQAPMAWHASPCQPYSAAATTPMVGNALALLTSDTPAGHMDAVIYSRAAPDTVSVQTPWHQNVVESLHQISMSSLRSDGVDLQDVPAHLQWEVDLIVRYMISALKLDPAAHQLRVTLSTDANTGLDQIYAIELLESASARRIEAAIWMERDEVPGAYFSLSGLDYERLLWQSPVQNARISRGVGPSVITVKRRVTVKTRKNAVTRTAVRSLRVKGHHIGIDFAAPMGIPVVAVADGEIIHAGINGGYGNLIIVDHGEGHHTYYAHLSAYAADIKPGTQVRRGEEIGYVGSTGFSTGPHLHFEIRKQGLFIDPAVKDNKLQFWTLDVKEQPEMLARLLRLQLAPAQQVPVLQAHR